jgi:hypothetical protein
MSEKRSDDLLLIILLTWMFLNQKVLVQTILHELVPHCFTNCFIHGIDVKFLVNLLNVREYRFVTDKQFMAINL